MEFETMARICVFFCVVVYCVFAVALFCFRRSEKKFLNQKRPGRTSGGVYSTYPHDTLEWNAIQETNQEGYEEIKCKKCFTVFGRACNKGKPKGFSLFSGGEKKSLQCCGGWIIHPTYTENDVFFACDRNRKGLTKNDQEKESFYAGRILD